MGGQKGTPFVQLCGAESCKQLIVLNCVTSIPQYYLNFTHWKLGTCLYELIYSEYSILPPPEIFTILPETSCIFIVVQRWLQTAVSSQPTENLTRVYMNLFIPNSPYYHLLKYLLFFLKHPVYFIVVQRRLKTAISSHPLKIGHMFILNYLIGNSPYHHHLKYLLFFLKHSAYFIVVQRWLQTAVSSHPLKTGHMFI